MEDLFVVKLDRISEEEIQRLCNPEDKKAKEENNNEDTTVDVDVSAIRKNFLEDLDDDEEDTANKENEAKNENQKKQKKIKNILGAKPQVAQVKKETNELSELEQLRLKNIQEMRSLLDQMKTQAKALESPKPKKTVTIRRKCPKQKFKKIYGTRSRRNSSDKFEELNDSYRERDLLYEERVEEDDDEDGDEVAPKKRRTHAARWGFNPNEDIRMPEDITDAELKDVADYVSEKVIFSSKSSFERFLSSSIFFRSIRKVGRLAINVVRRRLIWRPFADPDDARAPADSSVEFAWRIAMVKTLERPWKIRIGGVHHVSSNFDSKKLTRH